MSGIYYKTVRVFDTRSTYNVVDLFIMIGRVGRLDYWAGSGVSDES